MNAKKCVNHTLAATAAVVVVLLGFLLSAELTYAGAQCRIVRIYDLTTVGSDLDVSIEPQTIRAEGKICIIWVNLGKTEMKVNFRQGKACVDGTEAATGFKLSDLCYVTSWVPHGGTSSLTFTEEGIYVYDIEWEAANARQEGKIIVQ